MTRAAGLFFLLTAATAAFFLFHIKQQVREMEEELGIVHRDILRHQEEIQVLETEWSYLNRPARIAELAERHLQLTPIAAEQFVRWDALPLRDDRTVALKPSPSKTEQAHNHTQLTKAEGTR